MAWFRKSSTPAAVPPRSLRRRILEGLAVRLYRHAFLAALLLLVATGLAFWQGTRLQVSSSLKAQIPLPPREQAVWNAVQMISPSHDPVTATVEIKQDQLMSGAARAALLQRIQEAWSYPEYVSFVMPLSRLGAGRVEDEDRAPFLFRRLRPEDVRGLSLLMSEDDAGQRIREKWRQALEEKTGGDDPVSTATLAQLGQDPFQVLAEARATLNPLPPSYPALFPPDAYIQPEPNRLSFILMPVKTAGDFQFCYALKSFLEDTIEAVQEEGGAEMRLRLYGRHMDTARTAWKFRLDITRVLAILAVCLGLLLVLAFRKLESWFFLFPPPLIALVWTYGTVALFTPRLNLLSAMFPFLLMALGFEFVIQIYHRFVEELYRQKAYIEALRTAYSEAGRGIIVSTLVTALIFFTFQLSQLENLRELALVGGIGTVAMGVSSLLILPVLAAIKRKLAKGRVAPVEIFSFGLQDISAAVTRSPRTTLALGLIITAYFAWYAGNLRINQETGLDMGAPNTLAVRKIYTHKSRENVSDLPYTIVVEAPRLEEALGLNDRLYAILRDMEQRGELGMVRSLSPWLPSPRIQEAVRQELLQAPLENIRLFLAETAAALWLPADTFNPFLEQMQALRDYLSQPDWQPLSLTRPMERWRARLAQQRIIHADGVYRVVTAVFPTLGSPLTRPEGFAAFREDLEKQLPQDSVHFLGERLQNRRASKSILFSLALMVFLCILSLAVCLLPHFRKTPGSALLALIPIFCATVWSLGFLAVIKHPIAIYALLGFPLAIGFAVNQAILLLQRVHDRQYASLRQVMRSGGRPNLISGFALLLGFGLFFQVRFVPLRDLSLLLLLTVACACATTLLLVTAILEIRQEGGLDWWDSDEKD